MSTTSPIFRLLTSTSIGSAPLSSCVLKKIGAILPPKHTPPKRLFGMNGMSSPVCQITELVADLREEPVPTTSPTYATGWPLAFNSFSSLIGPISPGLSGVMPSRGFFSIASACSGISGRVHASGAGDKSSVLVSPSTLNTVTVIFSGTLGREVNHSASAQDFSTAWACTLPFSAFSCTSWKESNIRSVCFRPFAAIGASFSLSKSSISGWML